MILWYASLIGSTIGFTLGSVLVKRFTDTNAMPLLLLSFTVLAVRTMFFVQVLRSGLGQGIIEMRIDGWCEAYQSRPGGSSLAR